jgi:vancomycin resistance protein YoaR
MRSLAEMLRNRALLILAVSLLVLCGVYVGLATLVSGRVPSQARVNGIAIGGMSPHKATLTLERAMATRASRPVHLKVLSRTIDIQPRTAGLEIDLPATLADLTGFTLNPVNLWAHLTGASEQPLKLRVDSAKLTASVTKAARAVDSRVRQGSITFAGGRANVLVSAAGRRLKVPQTTQAVASAWPNEQVVQAAVQVTKPKLSAAEVRRAAKEFAVPAMSGPITVRAGGATFLLQPRQYAQALSVTLERPGRLKLSIDREKLLVAIREAAPSIERAPVDATLQLVAGKPQVVPAVVGARIDETSVPASFGAALTSPERHGTIRLVPITPTVTTAMAKTWRIEGPISTFTTQFPVNAPRTNNIKIAIRTLNDTVVPPGGQFSLNATLGQRTAAKGYQKAPVIFDGRLISDFGGGVSQVSTTTFNAAFFAGVRMDVHTPHSFYIARYPEGREATVSWPDVDQRWTNDTGGVIFIKASVHGNNVTVTLLGTKKWDVQAVKGPRRNVKTPKNIVDPHKGCVAQLPTPGFDVTVAQIFNQHGAEVRRVLFNSHYIPEDTVKCTYPDAR